MPVTLLCFLFMHPLHTTLTQLAWRPADRSVELETRSFADDVHAVAGDTDSSLVAYLRRAVTLLDRAGHPVPLRWCGARRTADVVWLCLRASAPRGPSGMGVHVGVLFDRYHDQVNIVQASYDGRRETMLFTPGDAPRALP